MALGWATIDDFSDSNAVLERLLMYEKRIESSLYKAMNELKKLQCMRKKEEKEKTQEMDTLAIQPFFAIGHKTASLRGRDARDTEEKKQSQSCFPADSAVNVKQSQSPTFGPKS